MAFIEQSDLERYIDPYDLNQIIQDDATVVPGAIDDGVEYAKEKLRQRFDVEFEFAQELGDRNNQLLKQTIAVVLFYICERLPTDVLPENRENAFIRADEWLSNCGSGKIMPNLQTLDDENQVGLSIRHGSTSTLNNNHY